MKLPGTPRYGTLALRATHRTRKGGKAGVALTGYGPAPVSGPRSTAGMRTRGEGFLFYEFA
jgi:hypothetical protein